MLCQCFVRPNPDTPCVMWRTSVTLSAFTSGVEGFVCCPVRVESYSRAKKKRQEKKHHDVHRVPHRPKRRARRGDRPLERAFVATKLGEVRTKTNAEKWRKGKEKKKKERNKQTKQGAFPFSTVQSAASQGCQWKSDVRNRRGPRSARQCRRARFPNSGCCCCCRRGAALLALFVSVRGQRAAAAAITAARRYSATVFSFSLTPLCPMVGGVGFSLLRGMLSVSANDVFGRRLVYSCGFEELEGNWIMVDSR